MVEKYSFQIRVCGHLTGQWLDWFSSLQIENTESGETLMRGELSDQSALFGVLDRIRSLGLEIVSLSCIAQSSETSPPAPSQQES